MISIFNANQVSQDAYFGANLVIPAQICGELSRGQTEFPRNFSKHGQNDLEGQGLTSIFNTTRDAHDACLVQIWWFQLKIVTCYRADKI